MKTLELLFKTEMGKPFRIAIQDPIANLDPAAVQQVMEQIVQQQVFFTNYGLVTAVDGARIVDRQVEELFVQA